MLPKVFWEKILPERTLGKTKQWGINFETINFMLDKAHYHVQMFNAFL